MQPMTIGAVARTAGVRSSLIRFYERSGVLPPALGGGRKIRPVMPWVNCRGECTWLPV